MLMVLWRKNKLLKYQIKMVKYTVSKQNFHLISLSYLVIIPKIMILGTRNFGHTHQQHAFKKLKYFQKS